MQYLALNGNQQTINASAQDTTFVNVHQLIIPLLNQSSKSQEDNII